MPYAASPAIPPGMDPRQWDRVVRAAADEGARLARILASGGTVPRDVQARALAVRQVMGALQGIGGDAALAADYLMGTRYGPLLTGALNTLNGALASHAAATGDDMAGWLAQHGWQAVPNRGALHAVASRTGQAMLHDWQRLTATTRRGVADAIANGIAAGINPREAARAVQAALMATGGGTYARGLLIARTEMADCYDASVMHTIRSVDGVIGYRYRAQPDACPVCQVLHGLVFPADEYPDRHHMCFPAGTMVQAPDADSGTARQYEGPMVRVRTASGRILTGTPNHPVLTHRQGWVPLGAVEVGGDLVAYRGGGRDRRTDVQEGVARIEDRVVALEERGASVGQGLPGDFHGDGAYGEVKVVGADGHLLAVRDAEGVQEPGHHGLARCDHGPAALPALGDPLAVAGRVWSARGEMGRSNHALPILGAHVDPSGLHGFRPATDGDLVRFQPAAYNAPAHLVAEGQRLLGQAGEVVADRVVEVVRQRQWSGHVYNLATAKGWYLAEGLVVSNCRCVIVPVLDDEGTGPGDYMPGQQRPRELVESQVPGSWQPLPDDLRDMLVKRENPGWRPSWTVRDPGGLSPTGAAPSSNPTGT